MSVRPRNVMCSQCHRMYTVNKDGTIRRHKFGEAICHGSGKLTRKRRGVVLEEIKDLLGTKPDAVIARKFGLTYANVNEYRRSLEIPSYYEVIRTVRLNKRRMVRMIRKIRTRGGSHETR